jgi:glycerate dehydrogenase
MNGKPKAVFLDFATLGPGIDTSRLDRLADTTYHAHSTADQVGERLEGQAIAIVNKASITAEAIAASTALELIVLSATGTDNVATAVARERGIAVTNTRDYCSASLAQHAFALILGLTQQIARYDRLVRSGAWQRSQSFALFDYPIRELAGRTLGLIGYGTLGQAVGRLGQCFGMQLMVAARPGTPRQRVAQGRQAFEAVLEQSDVLSLHCPLTPATVGLIGEAELARMKNDAVLINTARGGLVDSAALVAALRADRIAGAGIDVLAVEPPPADDVLLTADLPNLIITPHVAWTAREARQRALDQVIENIEDHLRGGSLRRVV